MTDEKLVSLMSESRLISAADNVIYPLIKLKIQQRLDLACGRFIGGATDFISDIAYIQGLKEIEMQLRKLQMASDPNIINIKK